MIWHMVTGIILLTWYAMLPMFLLSCNYLLQSRLARDLPGRLDSKVADDIINK